MLNRITHPNISIRALAAAAPALLLLALLLPAPGAHAASTPRYAVEVTGIHVVDWEYRGDGYPDTCKAWEHGSGTQTLGLRTKRAARYLVLDLPGVGPLLSMTKAGRYAGNARRTSSDWDDHAIPQTSACTPCGPSSEYGECDETPDPAPAPLHDCSARRGAGSAALDLRLAGRPYGNGDEPAALVDTLRITSSVVAAFPSCPPTQASGPGMRSAQPLDVTIAGRRVKRILRLRRGATLKLHGSEERGFARGKATEHCDGPARTPGYSECAVTDVTVEIRRVS